MSDEQKERFNKLRDIYKYWSTELLLTSMCADYISIRQDFNKLKLQLEIQWVRLHIVRERLKRANTKRQRTKVHRGD